MNKLKYFIPALLLLIGGTLAYAEVTFSESIDPRHYDTFTFFTATTTSATSTSIPGGGGYMKIAGAKRVTMYFGHGGTATTSTSGTKFSVQTSADGVTWTDFAKLLGPDVASTATSTYTIQGATTTVPVALDLSDDSFYAIRCVSTETASPLGTDGEHTCKASADF